MKNLSFLFVLLLSVLSVSAQEFHQEVTALRLEALEAHGLLGQQTKGQDQRVFTPLRR